MNREQKMQMLVDELNEAKEKTLIAKKEIEELKKRTLIAEKELELAQKEVNYITCAILVHRDFIASRTQKTRFSTFHNLRV